MKLHEYLRRAFEHASPHDRTDEQLAMLVRIGEVEDGDYVTDYEGNIQHRDEVFYCERTDHYYTNSDYQEITVHVNLRATETWCSERTECDWFYCELAEEYYDSQYYSAGTYGNRTICVEVSAGELCYWELDGEYHDEPEGDGEGNPRSGYHCESPSWRRGRNVDKSGLGIELEIEAKRDFYLEEICDAARNAGFIAEEDGSLNDELGVEIVARPFPLHALRKGQWGAFIEAIEGKAVGWDAGKGYGMHVSIGRDIPRLDQGKFLVFMHTQRNLCEIVAGRREVHWSKYKTKTVREGWVCQGEKYEAAAVRGPGRIEVRIFRSTLKLSSFLKNAQFVEAVREYATTHSIRDMGSSEKFLSMVERAGNRYRELDAFLKGRGFRPGRSVEASLIESNVERIVSEIGSEN